MASCILPLSEHLSPGCGRCGVFTESWMRVGNANVQKNWERIQRAALCILGDLLIRFFASLRGHGVSQFPPHW